MQSKGRREAGHFAERKTGKTGGAPVFKEKVGRRASVLKGGGEETLCL